MPSPSRLATLTANELTSVCEATACRMPSEPSTARPPTSTGSAAATSEPKMNSSSTRVIGSEISSAVPRSDVDRVDEASSSGTPPASCTVAPSTAKSSLIARNWSILAASSGPTSVITATALDLSLAAYWADLLCQYDEVDLTADGGRCGQPELDQLGQRRVADLALGGGVDRDHVAGLGAQRLLHDHRGVRRLAVRVVVAALGELPENAQPPEAGGHHRDERDGQHRPPEAGDPRSPAREHTFPFLSLVIRRTAPAGGHRSMKSLPYCRVAAWRATPPQPVPKAASVFQRRLILPSLGARYLSVKAAVWNEPSFCSSVAEAVALPVLSVAVSLPRPEMIPDVEPQRTGGVAGRRGDAEAVALAAGADAGGGAVAVVHRVAAGPAELLRAQRVLEPGRGRRPLEDREAAVLVPLERERALLAPVHPVPGALGGQVRPSTPPRRC